MLQHERARPWVVAAVVRCSGGKTRSALRERTAEVRATDVGCWGRVGLAAWAGRRARACDHSRCAWAMMEDGVGEARWVLSILILLLRAIKWLR